MLELRFIRENSELVREKILRRGMAPDLIDRFVEIDTRRLALLAEAENLKNRRNTVSREIAELKQRGDNAQAEPLIIEMRDVSTRIKELDTELAGVQDQLQDIVMSIPNLCDDSVPVGKDDRDNVEVKQWGEKPDFRLCAAAPLGDRRTAGDSRFRDRGQTRRRPLCPAEGLWRPPVPGPGQLLSRPAYPEARLPGGAAAVYGQQRDHDRHRPAAQIRR